MTTESQVYEFNSIYLSGKPLPTLGKIRFASGGIGWKDERTGKVTTVAREEMKKISWQRVAKDYGIRIQLQNGRVIRFDGFTEESYDDVSMCVHRLYGMEVEQRELSTRGWNWGQTEFQVNKPAFEIPMSEIVNSSMATKNEVSLELKGLANDENSKGDQLVEMRFFIPNKAEDEEMDEETSAATHFYETIKTMADIGVVTGESIVPFEELPFLVPRGRYEVDMFSDFIRMHGKSYDYKILYKSVKHLFLLPKPDDVHILLVIGLDPPIRQGQTRYPFLVMQFLQDEELEIELNLDQSELDEKFQGKLKKNYHAPTSDVVSEILSLMTGVQITMPSQFKSKNKASAVKCSYKANEGHIYPLENALLFVPKPATHMPYTAISQISFSRIAQGASSTFDMKVALKKGGEFQFGGLYKEEHASLEEFLKLKGLKVKNEVGEEENAAAAFDLSSSSDDEEATGTKEKSKKASATAADDMDEDSEEDEDFVAEDESDVAEEFDEQYESSGAGSDDDAEEEGGDGEEEEEEAE